jgi:hypothetical protein
MYTLNIAHSTDENVPFGVNTELLFSWSCFQISPALVDTYKLLIFQTLSITTSATVSVLNVDVKDPIQQTLSNFYSWGIHFSHYYSNKLSCFDCVVVKGSIELLNSAASLNSKWTITEPSVELKQYELLSQFTRLLLNNRLPHPNYLFINTTNDL